MKTYKIYFTSDILESIEVEASSEKEAKDMFETGVLDLSDAKEEAQENLKLDTVKKSKTRFLRNKRVWRLKNKRQTTTKGKKMTKKTYTIVAYYKEKFTYTVEAATEKEAKEIALDNQADWERMDEFINHEPPIIVQVMEE